MLLAAVVIFLLELTDFSRADCGKTYGDAGARIVGGTDGGYLQYPWFANIRKSYPPYGDPLCGGVLITRRHILTAAHCIPSGKSPQKKMNVALNTYDRCNDTEPLRKVFNVEKVFVHEDYAKNDSYSDLALMKLSKYVHGIEKVCMPRLSKQNSSEPGLVMGFGYTEEGGKNGEPCKLLQAKVHKYSPKECEATSIPELYQDTGLTFCGGGGEGVDTCQGDSGGPFITYDSKGRSTVAGVVSTGYGCARKDYPGIYTNVAAFLDWIEKRLEGEKTESAYEDDDTNEEDTDEEARTEETIQASHKYEFSEYDSSGGSSDNSIQRISFPGESADQRTYQDTFSADQRTYEDTYRGDERTFQDTFSGDDMSLDGFRDRFIFRRSVDTRMELGEKAKSGINN